MHSSAVATKNIPLRGPNKITAGLTPYISNKRIILVTLHNAGNKAAPKDLSRAVLIPYGVKLPHILAMAPNQTVYYIPPDGQVESIEIAIGTIDVTDSGSVDILLAVIKVTASDGDETIVHSCAQFDCS